MILVRDVYRLKPGRVDEALAVWRDLVGRAKRAQVGALSTSLLTDLVGPGETIVLERTFDDLAAFERGVLKLSRDEGWRERYNAFAPLAQSTYREIFTIVPEQE